MIALGVASIGYALNQRNKVPEEPVSEADSVEKQTTSVATEEAEAEAEQIYDQLFAEYVSHWGLQTGTQLLDNEIKAYTWQGDSFADAVRRIAEREKRKASRRN
jgi:hypothetical protein